MDYNNNQNNYQNNPQDYNQQPYGYNNPQDAYNNQPQYGYQQQQPYGYQQNYPYPQAKQPGYGFAVASLVLGIVSFFVFAFISGILAIIFGAVAKNKGNRSPMATAGIVCGVIGIVAMIILTIVGASFLGAFI